MVKKIVLFLTLFLTLFFASPVSAHQPIIVGNETIRLTDPEISRAFYDELDSTPQRYFIESKKDFELYLNLLVPLTANPNGRYSANIYDLNHNQKLIATINGTSTPWSVYYEKFAKDYYYKGPEYNQFLPAGNYAINIYSGDNQGKYVLAIGKKEVFSLQDTFKVIGILRQLKVNFFNTSPLRLITTIFGAAYFVAILIIAILIRLIFSKKHKIKLAFPKINQRRKITRTIISLILLYLSLYTWNPLIILFSNLYILFAIFG